MPEKPMDHASKTTFWKKLRKTKSTTFSTVASPNTHGGLLAVLAETDLEHGSFQLVEPPRRASLYSLKSNPTSEDLPTLSISEATPARIPVSRTMPARGPVSFDMLFSRSSSSSRSRYAFTPPIESSDTETNPRSLFEIRAFASALQRLHGKAEDDTAMKDEQERKRRTLKSTRMRPTTSATSSESGPFRSTGRFPLTPYPDRGSSLWGLWENHDTPRAVDGNTSHDSSSLSDSSAWLGSGNASSILVSQASENQCKMDPTTPAAKWNDVKVSVKSPQMVNAHSSAGRSMCGELDILAITPRYEAMLSLALSNSDKTVEQDDFARDIHNRLKEIMGIDPVI